MSILITVAARTATPEVQKAIDVRDVGGPSTPLVIPPSEYFEGIDGPWITFYIRIGTPAQSVRVTISTASSVTLAVLSQYGCTTQAFTSVPADCTNSRGTLFDPLNSSSWTNQGDYYINGNKIGLEENLGYVQKADFGLDTLGLGTVAGANGPTLKGQTVAGIATAEPFYLGIFGLGTQPVNFTTVGNFSAQSYFQNLKTHNVIPSLSWSYTAGAIYRLKKAYGQLIFGGYDTSKFTPQSTAFTLADDISRDIVVSIQSISYSGTTQTTLLTQPVYAFLDSTDPNLWLPNIVCDQFEAAFNLTADNTTGLYLISDTQHSRLLGINAEVTFVLSDSSGGGSSVDIVLPYGAFALTAKYPLVQNTSYYFPLKRAANDSQVTLGRTFFQEAYLTVDYERRNFSVSPCAWIDGAKSNIVTITSPSPAAPTSNTIPTSNLIPDSTSKITSKTTLSKGVIAERTAGILSILVALVGAVWYFWNRKRQSIKTNITKGNSESGVPTSLQPPWFKPELDSNSRVCQLEGGHNQCEVFVGEPAGMDSSRGVFEIDAQVPEELEGAMF